MRKPSLGRNPARAVALVALAAVMAVPSAGLFVSASSHREAPLISQDPAADLTDMYVFRSPDAPDTVTAIMNVWPFGEPAGGPNWLLFGTELHHHHR